LKTVSCFIIIIATIIIVTIKVSKASSLKANIDYFIVFIKITILESFVEGIKARN